MKVLPAIDLKDGNCVRLFKGNFSQVTKYNDDPISQVKEIIIQNNYASPDDILEIDARVKQKVIECEKFADESPYPEKNVMYDSVYEQEDYPFLKHKPE